MRVEVVRTEPSTLRDAMIIAGRMDNILSGSHNSYGFGNNQNTNRASEGPNPMQIGYINKKTYNRFSHVEKQRRIRSKLYFVCGKANCVALNHYRKLQGMGDKPSDHTKKMFLWEKTSARFRTRVQ